MVLFCLLLLGQSAGTFTPPKYPPKLKMQSRDYGPRPASTVPEGGQKNATFRRVYARPAGLRLLVKADCGRAPSKDELIRRAERISLPDGPPVQIDWGASKGERGAWFAVMYLERKVSTVDMVAEDGKYQVKHTRATDQGSWEVVQLSFKNDTCPKTNTLTNRDVRVAVLNALHTATLAHFRKHPGG